MNRFRCRKSMSIQSLTEQVFSKPYLFWHIFFDENVLLNINLLKIVCKSFAGQCESKVLFGLLKNEIKNNGIELKKWSDCLKSFEEKEKVIFVFKVVISTTHMY